jgi:hypothetical protein
MHRQLTTTLVFQPPPAPATQAENAHINHSDAAPAVLSAVG